MKPASNLNQLNLILLFQLTDDRHNNMLYEFLCTFIFSPCYLST